ncbi:MAG: VOC family protein [Deltaproteobacteria bacterium]|nr:VOC family protein [Deltaproteobacteria bacterium]
MPRCGWVVRLSLLRLAMIVIKIVPELSIKHILARFARSACRLRDVFACNSSSLWYSPAMGRVAGLKGMRHIAIKVSDVARSKQFYQNILGMDVVWEPDSHNVYLSSGSDNLAIHQITEQFAKGAEERQLDHFGFIVDSVERVRELEAAFTSQGVKIVHPFKLHRDGSASFYCADPDGIVIQMLYEPQLSSQTIK